VDNIWDLVKAQPITNRLYEVGKANEEAAAIKNKAVKTSAQIPPVPILDFSKTEDPAYSVTLSKGAVKASVQNVKKSHTGEPL